MTYRERKLLKELNNELYRKYAKNFYDVLPLKDMSRVELLRDREMAQEVYALYSDLKNGTDYTETAQYADEMVSVASYKVDLAFDWVSKETLEFMNLLSDVDSEACVVGGSVRDALLSLTPKDFDFVTSTPYDVLKTRFEERGYKCSEVGKHFLVLTVWVGDEQFDVANFRKDGTYVDGRRPESVEVGTLEDDAFRRDFTVNALYYNLTTKKLLDPTGMGLDDAMNKVLRFVGKPEDRLKEDYLRLWRAFRLKKSKGLEFAPDTERALGRLFEEAYKNSDPARVLQEMRRLVK